MSATIFGPRIMLIGGGAIGRAPELLVKLGIQRPLIVSDPFMVSSGLIAALTADARAALRSLRVDGPSRQLLEELILVMVERDS